MKLQLSFIVLASYLGRVGGRSVSLLPLGLSCENGDPLKWELWVLGRMGTRVRGFQDKIIKYHIDIKLGVTTATIVW